LEETKESIIFAATVPTTLPVEQRTTVGLRFFIIAVMNYNKQPIDFPQQLDILRERGLIITDENNALELLASISYFRLASYWCSMEMGDENTPHRFYPNTYFDDVVNLYVFDKELRTWVFNAIQDIEIALRTKIIHYFSLKHGTFWFMDNNLFKDENIHSHCLTSIKNELGRSKEEFIQEHFAKYDNPLFPPVWKTLEIVSFGTLSKLYCNMKDVEVKKQVAKSFHLPQYLFLENWIKAASVLRNYCAHHARLWNRRFPVIPKLPQELPLTWIDVRNVRPIKLYAQLCYLAYLEQSIKPNSAFSKEIVSLLSTKPQRILKAMGFPPDWESEPLWQN